MEPLSKKRMSSATEPDAEDLGGVPQQQQQQLRDMSRGRLTNYVQDIIRNQTKPFLEIVRKEVLPYLPATALLRFRAVSPSWRSYISTPFFQHRQSNKHRSLSGYFMYDPNGDGTLYLPFNPTAAHNLPCPDPLQFLLHDQSSNTVHALASSYGLVLSVNSSNSAIRDILRCPAYTVSNPATALRAELPQRQESSHDGVALVFEPSDLNFVADYLVVSTFRVRDGKKIPPTDHRKFVVFCSGAEEWRPVSRMTFPGKETDLLSPHGVVAGSRAYWRTIEGEILSYDPRSDAAAVVHAPPEASVDRAVVWQLGELGRRLCCVSYDVTTGALALSTLVLDSTARQPGWEMLRSIDIDPSVDVRPLMFHGGDGEVVAWVEGIVIAYKAATGEGRILCEAPVAEFEFLPYISSFVSVKMIRGEGHDRH